jgi:CubicO group peptidase (beta-lactamase class C family)
LTIRLKQKERLGRFQFVREKYAIGHFEIEPALFEKVWETVLVWVKDNGYVVYERYFRRKSAASIHNMASVTKSVISALVGIAIDKGYIKSIDE